MKLLLCEDEKDLSKAISTMLELNDFKVDQVYDGEMAMEYINNYSYDLIITDYMMPKKNGIELIKEVRSLNNSIPIIMLTAKSEIDDKVEGLMIGANDYLTKPFDFKELIARISVLTRKNNNSLIKYEDITLDKSVFEIKSNSGSLVLINKEFNMLELLIKSPGEKITTERFIENIWYDEEIIEDSIVVMYIKYLEKKLKLLGSHITIKGNGSLGYSLDLI